MTRRIGIVITFEYLSAHQRAKNLNEDATPSDWHDEATPTAEDIIRQNTESAFIPPWYDTLWLSGDIP